MNVSDEQKFPKTSVCIILVDLVYLESAKIYTGSKIVRGNSLIAGGTIYSWLLSDARTPVWFSC